MALIAGGMILSSFRQPEETLNKPRFVILLLAGIQENQRTGFRRPKE
jgi:hypothetical protein